MTCPTSFGHGPNPSKRSKVSICEHGRPQEDTLKFYSCVNLECPCLQKTSNHTLSLGEFLLFYWSITNTYLDILNSYWTKKTQSQQWANWTAASPVYKPEHSSHKWHLSSHSVAQICARWESNLLLHFYITSLFHSSLW